MYKNIFFLFALLNSFLACSATDKPVALHSPQRAMILACEPGSNENIHMSLNSVSGANGILAITGTVINALYQEAAPVLMSEALYENIYLHGQVFKDFIALDYEQLYVLYGKYARFNEYQKVVTFAQDCRYAYNLYMSFLSIISQPQEQTEAQVKMQLKQNPVFDKMHASAAFKSGNLDAIDEVQFYLQAYLSQEKAVSYAIRIAQEPVYLCISKSYAKEIGLNGELCNISIQQLEKALGISLKGASFAQPITIRNSYVQRGLGYQTAFVQTVQQLFEKKSEHMWSFYLTGHGMFYKQAAINKNIIMGLTVDQFRSLLQLFNDKVNTKCVFYDSCCCGGQNFVDTYTNKVTGKSHTFNYLIATNTIAEATTNAYVGMVPVCLFYDNKKDMNLDLNDVVAENGVSIKLKAIFNLKKFFTLLQESMVTPEQWKNVFSCVSGYVSRHPNMVDAGTGMIYDRFLADIPSVRLPNAEEFRLLDETKCTPIATSCTVAQRDNQAFLLYATQIDSINYVAEDTLPPCISLIPGNARHIVGHLNAPKNTLSDVIKSFNSLPELQSSKMFHIRKLTCINDLESMGSKQVKTFTDVIIFHNVTLEGADRNVVFATCQDTTYYYTWNLSEAIGDVSSLMKPIKDRTKYVQTCDTYNAYFDTCVHARPPHAELPLNFAQLSAHMQVTPQKIRV